ncbi:MAG: NAD(P)/FAD-dependent oxidoreductase [Candidatus Heimdallarchaeota archaeon]
MSNEICDLAIVGPGLTGLSAAVAAYCKDPNLTIKIFGIPFDSNTAKKGEIENIPGINKIIGVDFIQQLVEQVESFNTEFAKSEMASEDFSRILSIGENVTSIIKKDSKFEITTENGINSAKSVIISTGIPELKHTIKGEDDLLHKGVSHCAVCDGALFRGKKVCIIGEGNTVARGALFLRKYCRKVTVLIPSSELKCDLRNLRKIKSSPNIVLKFNIPLDSLEVFGTQIVEGITYSEEGESKELSVNAVFIELKDKPNLSLLEGLGVETTDEGFIQTDENNTTNIDGLFAAGTIRGEIDYAAILMGDGYKTGIYAVEYLKKRV